MCVCARDGSEFSGVGCFEQKLGIVELDKLSRERREYEKKSIAADEKLVDAVALLFRATCAANGEIDGFVLFVRALFALFVGH